MFFGLPLNCELLAFYGYEYRQILPSHNSQLSMKQFPWDQEIAENHIIKACSEVLQCKAGTDEHIVFADLDCFRSNAQTLWA